MFGVEGHRRDERVRDIYLGDSYDLVKRFWAESLQPLARLYAHPRFVPTAIRTRYTAVTAIPVLDPDKPPVRPFGLLLDPHTGIPLPAESPAEASASHAPLEFIVGVNAALHPEYMICFDQSYHRWHELTRPEQLERKREFLQAGGISSFYYDSHAPFLFMAERAESLAGVKERLVSLGVPQERFVVRSQRRTRRCT
jgi:hypothetical protein